MLLVFWTAVNLAINFGLYAIMLRLYGMATDLGQHTVGFHVIHIQPRRRRIGYDILCIHHETYKGALVLSKDEQETINNNRTGYVRVYVRQFPSRLLSPNLETYEFSLQKQDWEARDRKICRRMFWFLFLAMETIILMIGFQI